MVTRTLELKSGPGVIDPSPGTYSYDTAATDSFSRTISAGSTETFYLNNTPVESINNVQGVDSSNYSTNIVDASSGEVTVTNTKASGDITVDGIEYDYTPTETLELTRLLDNSEFQGDSTVTWNKWAGDVDRTSQTITVEINSDLFIRADIQFDNKGIYATKDVTDTYYKAMEVYDHITPESPPNEVEVGTGGDELNVYNLSDMKCFVLFTTSGIPYDYSSRQWLFDAYINDKDIDVGSIRDYEMYENNIWEKDIEPGAGGDTLKIYESSDLKCFQLFTDSGIPYDYSSREWFIDGYISDHGMDKDSLGHNGFYKNTTSIPYAVYKGQAIGTFLMRDIFDPIFKYEGESLTFQGEISIDKDQGLGGVMSIEGLEYLAKQLSEKSAEIALGDGTAEPTRSDTGLANELYRSPTDEVEVSREGEVVEWIHRVPYNSSIDDKEIYEMGLFLDGELVHRKLVDSIVKYEGEQMDASVTINVANL